MCSTSVLRCSLERHSSENISCDASISVSFLLLRSPPASSVSVCVSQCVSVCEWGYQTVELCHVWHGNLPSLVNTKLTRVLLELLVSICKHRANTNMCEGRLQATTNTHAHTQSPLPRYLHELGQIELLLQLHSTVHGVEAPLRVHNHNTLALAP